MYKIKLKDIIDNLEVLDMDDRAYFSKKNGQIVVSSVSYMGIAEESEEEADFSEYSEDDRDLIEKALDIIKNWDEYVTLPDKFEINEYKIMEEYCLSLDDERKSDELYHSIKGSGAFRRFKDKIYAYGLNDDWYKYRDEALSNIAISWCEINGIEYSK